MHFLLLIERMNCLEAMSSEFVGLYHFVEKTKHFVEQQITPQSRKTDHLLLEPRV